MKWMAGFVSAIDWILCPATEENMRLYSEDEYELYDSFLLAKTALRTQVKQQIVQFKVTLRDIERKEEDETH